MLKIKDDVDLKELEKFGFSTNKYYPLSYVKKVYLCNENDDENFYHILKETREIELTNKINELVQAVKQLDKKIKE